MKEGAVVIDVGIHRNAENKLCGDVGFGQSCTTYKSQLLQLQVAVDYMTIAMLMNNCAQLS